MLMYDACVPNGMKETKLARYNPVDRDVYLSTDGETFWRTENGTKVKVSRKMAREFCAEVEMREDNEPSAFCYRNVRLIGDLKLIAYDRPEYDVCRI